MEETTPMATDYEAPTSTPLFNSQICMELTTSVAPTASAYIAMTGQPTASAYAAMTGQPTASVHDLATGAGSGADDSGFGTAITPGPPSSAFSGPTSAAFSGPNST